MSIGIYSNLICPNSPFDLKFDFHCFKLLVKLKLPATNKETMNFEKQLTKSVNFRSFRWAGLIFLLAFAACGGKQIATVPSEAEAIEIMDVLRENEIQSDKASVGDEKTRQFQITINEDSFGDSTYSAALQVLRDNCLPHQAPPPVDEGGFVASIEAERAKVQRQLKMNIIGQLRKLAGVTCVDVNFVLPQDQFAAMNPYPAVATVLVSYKNEQINFNEQDIKNMVAGSIPNLQADRVSVKLSYQPVRAVPRSPRSNTVRILTIGGAGLLVILGSIFLVYWLQKRRHRNDNKELREAHDEAEEELDETGNPKLLEE